MIGGEQAAVLTSDWLWQDHKERCIYTQANGIMGGDSSGHQWANGNCATALGVICEAVGQVRTNQRTLSGHVITMLTSDWSGVREPAAGAGDHAHQQQRGAELCGGGAAAGEDQHSAAANVT